ncbi:restriction endonuclease subunit S [Bosea sp. RAC05]|uniref:restriction endonuclease subunit S n=1 Tax=Bosea sp. RAC05 TaxID=1842539 RepID=UPI000857D5B3|nr:restriction endonuclease subunit S [Bosea sp. RAC05]AOG06107.1 type I restriction modification DNA specificity domain protein [Bosea sp. RAC05]
MSTLRSWAVTELGKVMTLQRGYDLPSRLRRGGAIPIVSSSGVSDFHAEAASIGPGVVTGRYGTIGQTFYVEGDYWPLNTTLFVSDFHGNHPKFCYYILKTVDFASHSGKSGVPGINRNDIHELALCYPTFTEEQQAIVEALGDADALIEALEALIAKKRDIKQGAMQDLLTGQRRLPGFRGEWAKAAIGNLFDFGRSVPLSRAQLSEEGDVSYVHYGDIHTRLHTHLDFQRTPTPGADKALCGAATPLRVGDWVFADASEDYDGVAKAVEVIQLPVDRSAVAGLHTFILRERVETFAPRFKGYLAYASSFRSQVMRSATGMKVFGISKSQMKEVELHFPLTLDEQRAIATVLSDMDAEIAALEDKLAKAREVKQGMMQVLLTGEIRLV